MDSRIDLMSICDPRTHDPWALLERVCDHVVTMAVADVAMELSAGCEAIVEGVLINETSA